MSARTRSWILAASLLGCGGAIACSSSSGAARTTETDAGTKAEAEMPSSQAPSNALYPTLQSLHEGAVSRTCALNNGVCHNSKEFPDLHTPLHLVDLVEKPCNMNAQEKADVHNACEPEGDHLVIPWAGLDAEIAHVDIAPPDVDFTKPAGPELDAELAKKPTARIKLVVPIPGFAIPASNASQGDIEVRRGPSIFPIRKNFFGTTDGAYVKAASGDTLTLGLEQATSQIRALVAGFLDDREYPWNVSMVRVADPNGDGVLGSRLGIKSIVPGQPMKSYALLRLVDKAHGDLMPRVCRTWTEEATRALGCWIEGLKTERGAVTNADDPIDYARCAFEVAGRGQCFSSDIGSVDAIFAKSCGGTSCHIGQTSGGLDLSIGKARANLVDVPSTGMPAQVRVKAGSVADSYLLCKLDPNCLERAGAPMPLAGPPLGSTEIAILKSWIQSGAR